MRAPATRTMRSMRATQPSTPPSNVRSAGPQGTPGGKARRKPGVAGRKLVPGQEIYLWILVLIEIALIGGFRKYFRRFHGG
jgi:hypothetical protein